MKKHNKEIKKVRVTFPIDEDINDMLNETASLLDTSKSQLIRDILREVIPETYSSLKNAQRLIEEGRGGEAIPQAMGSTLHKMASFFESFIGESSKKK